MAEDPEQVAKDQLRAWQEEHGMTYTDPGSPAPDDFTGLPGTLGAP